MATKSAVIQRRKHWNKTGERRPPDRTSFCQGRLDTCEKAMDTLSKRAVGIYMLVLTLAIPSLFVLCFFPDARSVDAKDTVRPVADAALREYVDKQYQFAFRYPADWKLVKHFPLQEAGEVRVMLRHPFKPMLVAAMVGHLERNLTKQEFESSPKRETMVAAMIEITLEEVYQKASRDIGAEQMSVSEKQALPSAVGIKFSIATAHRTNNVTTRIAGTHIVPFGKPYIVSFIVVTPVDTTATKDTETMTRVFSSFHLLAERGMK